MAGSAASSASSAQEVARAVRQLKVAHNAERRDAGGRGVLTQRPTGAKRPARDQPSGEPGPKRHLQSLGTGDANHAGGDVREDEEPAVDYDCEYFTDAENAPATQPQAES